MNLIPKENNPCYKCTDRKALCRIGCKRYKEFQEQVKAMREKSYIENRDRYEMYKYNAEKSKRLKAYKERGIR